MDWNPSLWAYLHDPVVSAGLACTSLLGVLAARKRFRRIPSAEFVTPPILARKRVIKGTVTRVGDADNFRLYHTPFPSWLRRVPTDRKALQDQTLHVRIAGADAPEMAHFGKPAQPFSQEAYNHLSSLVLHKTVKVQLLRKDQYSRIVGLAFVRKFPYLWHSSISLEMVKAGLATVYTGQGAEYGGKEAHDKLIAAEDRARRRKIGMWSMSSKSYESPSEYKKRTKA